MTKKNQGERQSGNSLERILFCIQLVTETEECKFVYIWVVLKGVPSAKFNTTVLSL